MMFDLKPLTVAGVPAALEKADRYRLLGEPVEADSICRDILAVDPSNQRATVGLILAITQQFGTGTGGDLSEAAALVNRLESEYDRVYYEGVVCERRAKELLIHGTLGAGPAAFEYFRKAMEAYELAEGLREPGDDSAVLRWNTCARIVMRNDLRPAPGPPSRLHH